GVQASTWTLMRSLAIVPRHRHRAGRCSALGYRGRPGAIAGVHREGCRRQARTTYWMRSKVLLEHGGAVVKHGGTWWSMVERWVPGETGLMPLLKRAPSLARVC